MSARGGQGERPEMSKRGAARSARQPEEKGATRTGQCSGAFLFDALRQHALICQRIRGGLTLGCAKATKWRQPAQSLLVSLMPERVQGSGTRAVERPRLPLSSFLYELFASLSRETGERLRSHQLRKRAARAEAATAEIAPRVIRRSLDSGCLSLSSTLNWNGIAEGRRSQNNRRLPCTLVLLARLSLCTSFLIVPPLRTRIRHSQQLRWPANSSLELNNDSRQIIRMLAFPPLLSA